MNDLVGGLPMLSLITFTPLIGAIVIAFLPRERLNWIRFRPPRRSFSHSVPW